MERAACSRKANERKWCSITYKMRRFYSKGAFFIVFWMSLIIVSVTYMLMLQPRVLFKDIKDNGHYFYFAMTPGAVFLFSGPIVGWIADTWCGNYRVFRAGNILLLLATVIGCICSLVLFQVPEHSIISLIISGGVSSIAYIILAVGLTAILVTAIQLGLDQMPDASSANITSFIAWITLSGYFGGWLVNTGSNIYTACINDTLTLFETNINSQVFSLFPVVTMTVMCCFLFLAGSKWLTIEPNCPQSLKLIYQVLKFAWNHKTPINRSALTYWEEDIPSRMDLGKSRYGGPFTTEEVEDVKTFFKILIIFLPIVLTMSSFNFGVYEAKLRVLPTECQTVLLYSFTYGPAWIMIITTLVHEFIIYPLIQNRVLSILKRIGIISFTVFVLNCTNLVLELVPFSQITQWFEILLAIFFLSTFTFSVTTLLNFVCAQSPYRMRGLLLGYAIFLYLISSFANVTLYVVCHQSNYCTIIKAVFTATSLAGFVLYCLLARWYKMRVRDEEYNVHRVVEEIYDRYLSQTPINAYKN